MHVIRVANVNEAFWRGLRLLQNYSDRQQSRAGDVMVCPEPVMTEYLCPMERVLLAPYRDANPVFHLMESLHMLAGRNDATFLDQFVHDFSARFAEPDGHQHGAYGFRWRCHFDLDGGGEQPLDQLKAIINLLRANPNDRRVVLQMWDPVADLGASKRDVPCNVCALPRIVDGRLELTVICRSNDLWWGAYGTNAVTFSVLQEYLARRIGVGIGIYRQFSNNFHIYTDIVDQLGDPEAYVINPYAVGHVVPTPIVTVPEHFDVDLNHFMNGDHCLGYQNSFFPDVALPLLVAYKNWRSKFWDEALALVRTLPENCDWRTATEQWMARRMVKVKQEA